MACYLNHLICSALLFGTQLHVTNWSSKVDQMLGNLQQSHLIYMYNINNYLYAFVFEIKLHLVMVYRGVMEFALCLNNTELLDSFG